jgi:glucosamine kinase
VHIAEAGGSNPHDNPDWKAAFAALLAEVSVYIPRVSAATIGIGSYRENADVDDVIRQTLTGLFPLNHLDIENDVYVAHDAAFLGQPGVVLIAGTGSMAVARGSDGRLARVGGWDIPVGDEGSAYWIGREALSLLSRMLDGRALRTEFADALCSRLIGRDQSSPQALLEWLSGMSHTRSEIAAVSKEINQLASAGDPDALGILNRAADYLAEHVAVGRRVAGLGDTGPWSLLGGLSNSDLMRTALAERVGPATDPALPPCGGAAFRAARTCGWDVDEQWIARLAGSLGAPPEASSIQMETTQ